jgi:hypothetical protein
VRGLPGRRLRTLSGKHASPSRIRHAARRTVTLTEPSVQIAELFAVIVGPLDIIDADKSAPISVKLLNRPRY